MDQQRIRSKVIDSLIDKKEPVHKDTQKEEKAKESGQDTKTNSTQSLVSS
jgi:hypothetical protein